MIYSHSRVTTFVTCPLKYRYQYLDGLGKELEDDHLSLILGKSVHAALEFLYTRVSDHVSVKLEEVMAAYDQQRTGHIQVNEGSGEESSEEYAMTYYKRWRIYLNRYYTTYAPFSIPKPMRVEYRLQFALDPQINFQWILDRIDIDGDTITIVDYKTNKALPTNDHDAHHDQLALYGLGIEQKYAWKYTRLLGKLIYLHLEKEVQFEITAEEIDRIKDKYVDIIKDIEQKTTVYMQWWWDQEAFKPKVWHHCDYCPFQQICPARKHHYMEDEQISLTDLGASTIKKMIDEYARLSKQYSEIEKQKNLLKEQLVGYAQEKKLPKLFGNSFKLSLVEREYLWVIDEETAKIKLKEHNSLEDILKIDTTKLQKLLDQAEQLAQEMKDCISRKHIAYFAAPSAIKEYDEPVE